MNNLAIITGATSGLGRAFAHLLAEESVDLLLLGRNVQRLEEGKAECEAIQKARRMKVSGAGSAGQGAAIYKTDTIALDLAERDWLDRLDAAVAGRPVSHLMNNAGFGDYGAFEEADLAYQEAMVDTNVRALTTLTHYFLNHRPQNSKSYLMNMASIAAFQAGPLMPVYFASKAYVRSLTRAVAFEYRNDPLVHISCCCPGPTKTGFAAQAHLDKSGLKTNFHVMTPAEVAKITLDGLYRGQTVIIPGWRNKVLKGLSRMVPSYVMEFFTHRMIKKENEK